mmetsp:Transcript_10837/g.10466  ORF Transcript_10837/g.10466 Transcript_10837/m.10466 type:complete len:401 (-) Transcript_10837:3693-4895(-)|eukprot:CAMPEP_0119042642 /NCGR_PEP_ID=MMETSP1177-20130426/16045_1 /TAXON_ID=2985 /ORGANISM="Ochromonas sp, Strain CCMP1899" /LENGTH=400 /DNA_ID=CAMNT_0007009573 /DNA_START=115 /DNA_END=1317 /DNA_ORIENTATION=-
MIRTIIFRKNSLRNPLSSVHRFNSSNGGDGDDKKESESAAPTGPVSTPATPGSGINAPKPYSTQSERGEETRNAYKTFQGAAPKDGGSGAFGSMLQKVTPVPKDNDQGAPKAWNRNPVAAGAVGTGAPGGDARPERSFNNRVAPKKFAPRGGSGDSGPGGGFGGEPEEVARRADGGKSRNRGDDNFDDMKRTSKAEEDEPIPDEIWQQITEDFFREQARKGMQIDTAGMDPVDAFLAEMYQESFKVEGNSIREVLVDKKWHRTRLPKPRNIRALVAAMTPQITTVEKGSEAYHLGATAFSVLSKNYYYSEGDQRYMGNEIARQAQKFHDEMDAIDESKVDLIYHKNFRKGHFGIDDELRRLRLSQSQVSDVYEFDSEDRTDWNQDAVVDEDEIDWDSDKV